VLCIIEAMKLMNEIEAEVAGEVLKVHPRTGSRSSTGTRSSPSGPPEPAGPPLPPPAMFKKVLIANRGEIALRVMWACKELGLRTVAVYSEADAGSLHVRFADEACAIGPPRNIDSYLNIPAIISAAEITGAGRDPPRLRLPGESAYLARSPRPATSGSSPAAGDPPHGRQEPGEEGDGQGRRSRRPRLERLVEDEEKAVRIAKDIGFRDPEASAGGAGGGCGSSVEAKDLAQSYRAPRPRPRPPSGSPTCTSRSTSRAPAMSRSR